jgi:exosome complex exonuclease DIS3/RRP44
VHRQLSAAISYTPLHGSLHSKAYVEKILKVVNKRHRLAQMAGRASVEFYVGLALKARGQQDGKDIDVIENAFVIRAFRNGLAVFVSSYVQVFFLGSYPFPLHFFPTLARPSMNCTDQKPVPWRSYFVFIRLGLEGLVTFKKEVKFDPEAYSVFLPVSVSGVGGEKEAKISVFDKVKVRIVVEQDKNTLRGKVKMILVSPVDSTNM